MEVDVRRAYRFLLCADEPPSRHEEQRRRTTHP